MTDPRHALAMDVFLHACELTQESQQSYLDQACSDDTTLRAEVTSLLRHHQTETILAETRRLNVRTRIMGARPRRTTARSAWLQDLDKLPLSFWLSAFVGITVLVLAVWTRSQIYQSLQASLRQDLHTVLEADVRALQHWVGRQQLQVKSWAEHAEVRRLTKRLQAVYQTSDESTRVAALKNAPEGAELMRLLQPIHGRLDFVGVMVFNDNGVFLLHKDPERVGESLSSEGQHYLTRIENGETVLVKPMRAIGVEPKTYGPLMAVATPIREESSRVIGGLAFIFPSDDEYSQILSVAQLGESGETYAFDADYTLLSNPRHPELLVAAGMVGEGEEVALAVDVRVPGKGPPDSWSPTRIVEAAVKNKEGVDVDGYLNYLGNRVVGVSKWLDDLDFGVCTEIGYDEAFAPVHYIDRFSLILVGLNFFFAAVTGLYTVLNLRLRRAVGAARQLGSYTQGELIGEGGMGKVYLAQHALLRRPTAVKLLDGKLADDETVARFEREVQLTSQLTHPNTIQIYDFGRTSDDVFYFAMEYLRGPTLSQLVEQGGALPPGRAAYLLLQACGSLKEAHDLGLIHRDVKPANIILCRRGGCFDFVKVLDFGLVKSFLFLDAELTQQGTTGGTPAYIAPERLSKQEVDHRSDIFSLGAVAYYLLTGQAAFQGSTSYLTLEKVLGAEPTPLSELSNSIPAELEDLVMRCLAKSPADRPADLGVVISELLEFTEHYPWSQADARSWWEAYEARSA